MSENTVIFGINLCKDALKGKDVSKVYITKDREREFTKYIKQHDASYVVVDKKYLDNITQNANHQGIALVMSPVEYISIENLIEKNSKVTNPLILIIDEIHDVNNLGAVLRNVDAFGINGIIINKKRNVQLNATVAKISTGAINHVDICRVTNLSATIKQLKQENYWVACLDMDGEKNLKDESFSTPMAVVLGGEDKGITHTMKKNCDYSIKIDMYGSVNSLNVSCASAVLCYSKSIKR